MKYQIVAIPSSMINLVWNQIEPHIDLAVAESHGDLDKGNLRGRLESGQETILAVCEGSTIITTCIIAISILDGGRKVLFIPSLGGDNMNEWIEEGLKSLQTIAKELGCDGIRACGRPGWVRVIPNAKILHTVIEF